jgi:hypothetical protein
LADTSINCSSVYGGICKRRNLDCKGLDSLVISLHVPNTFAPLILKSYCLRNWPTFHEIEQLVLKLFGHLVFIEHYFPANEDGICEEDFTNQVAVMSSQTKLS